MAKVKYGPTVVGLLGTIGGITFSQNKSGPYAKPWGKPPSVRNVKQTLSIGHLTTTAQNWRTITPTQRADWDTWASTTAPQQFDGFGDPIELSGFQWFIKLNTKLLYVGQSINAPAPVIAQPTAPTIVDWRVSDDDSPTCRIVYATNSYVGLYLYAHVATTKSVGATSFAQPNYRTIFTTTPPATAFLPFTELIAQFGALPLQRNWFLRLYKMTTEGLLSPDAEELTETVT